MRKNLSSSFSPKMSPKIQNALEPRIKSLLFLIAQTQQAALQTAISQNPVRNFPSGSHLSPWWIEAAELWSVRAEKFWFFFFPELHQVMPYCRLLGEILMAIICWWPHCDFGDLGLFGRQLVTSRSERHRILFFEGATWSGDLQDLCGGYDFPPQLSLLFCRRNTCQLKTEWVALFCFVFFFLLLLIKSWASVGGSTIFIVSQDLASSPLFISGCLLVVCV